jgi:N-acetylmuramoyl-L-alanine amidase
MIKLALDAGHGGNDPGAIGALAKEKDINLHIAYGVKYRLETEYQGVEVSLTRRGDETVSLKARTTVANAWGAHFLVSLHSNAGGGTGFESYRHPNANERVKEFQYAVHAGLMQFYKTYNLRDRGKKTANFHILRESSMPAILLENLFVDNEQDHALLVRVEFRNLLISAATLSIAKAIGLKPKQEEPSVLYKVQVGAFRDRANAERLKEDLKVKGYNAFIVEERR